MDQYCFHCMKPLGISSICSHCGHSNSELKNTPPYHLVPGSVLHDKYLVGRVLGEGGFGITYMGLNTILSKRVAIKEFYPNGAANRTNSISKNVIVSTGKELFFQNGVERFLQEAKNVAMFSEEEGVVDILDYFQENSTAYIVMEYLEGETLQSFVNTKGPMNSQEVISRLIPVIKSLAVMHKEGIIHRDISPDNIMYTRHGKMKLMDFGSARYFTNEERAMSIIVKQGYAPVEQYSSKSKQGPFTDVYALCATIYACITGKVPEYSLDRVSNDTLVPPSKLGFSILPHHEAALMHGLKVNAKERTQNMDALYQEFITPIAASGGKSGKANSVPVNESTKTDADPQNKSTGGFNNNQKDSIGGKSESHPVKPNNTGYVPPKTGDTGYVPPKTGNTGYVPPKTGNTGYVPPKTNNNGYYPPKANNSYRQNDNISGRSGYYPANTKPKKNTVLVIVLVIVGALAIAGGIVGIVLGSKSCSSSSGSSANNSSDKHKVYASGGNLIMDDTRIDTSDSTAESKINKYLDDNNFKQALESYNSQTNGVCVMTAKTNGNAIVCEVHFISEQSESNLSTFLTEFKSSLRQGNISQLAQKTAVDNCVMVVAVTKNDGTVIYSNLYK